MASVIIWYRYAAVSFEMVSTALAMLPILLMYPFLQKDCDGGGIL